MSQHPISPRPDRVAADPAERTAPEPTQTKEASDLSVNKVLAGAGAAATSAILGSYFGVAGTVTGAAVGSVASTLTTTLYQRSLDRTRDTLVARIRLTSGRPTAVADAQTTELTVPMPRVSPEAETTQLQVEPAIRRPRRAWLLAGVTVLVFVLGLLAVTGIEWAKGSTLSTGQPGTSVGRVLAPPLDGAGNGAGDGAVDGAGDGAGQITAESDPVEPTDEPTGQPGGDRTGAGGPGGEPGSTAEPTPNPESAEEPTPTDEPDSGPDPSAPAREDAARPDRTTLPTTALREND
jgi:hypothetical protein